MQRYSFTASSRFHSKMVKQQPLTIYPILFLMFRKYFEIFRSTNRENNSIEFSLNISGYRSRHSHSVLMIIDAMRLDFAVQNDSMKYFSKLMRNDDACLYHLRVQPPTVTLPRIKVGESTFSAVFSLLSTVPFR